MSGLLEANYFSIDSIGTRVRSKGEGAGIDRLEPCINRPTPTAAYNQQGRTKNQNLPAQPSSFCDVRCSGVAADAD